MLVVDAPRGSDVRMTRRQQVQLLVVGILLLALALALVLFLLTPRSAG